MSLTLFGPQINVRVQLCQAVAELAGLTVAHKVISLGETKNPEFLKRNPLGQVPVLETPEGNLYQTNAIIRHFARLGKGLYGSNNVQTSHIDQWLDFLNCDILPAIQLVSGPVLGWFPQPDKQTETKSHEDLQQFLTVLNSHLNGRQHIVGDHTSVADVAYAVFLSVLFRSSVDAAFRNQFPNVVALVLSQFENKALQNYFGRVNASSFPNKAIPITTIAVAPAAPAAPQESKKEEKKNQGGKKEEKKNEGGKKDEKKNQGGKKDQPKKDAAPAPKKEEKPKPAAKPKDDDDDGEEKPAKKEKNELDLLPPSTWNMVDWKLRFVNSTDRVSDMKWFWENIDKAGYSLWNVYYDKFGSEGTKLWLTCNLKNGYLQRFDEFRKYVFGTYGVYGEEPKLETQGIWFFRGQEIPFLLQDIPGSENHIFTKLDWDNPEHRKKTEEAWVAYGKDDEAIVGGLRAREVTLLR